MDEFVGGPAMINFIKHGAVHISDSGGKSILFIRKTKASCGCTAVTLGQKEIQPGQSTTIRATFDSTGKSGRQYKSITVITNDPSQPENTLTISGNVK